jgi:glucosamine-6-phosphate deaminase
MAATNYVEAEQFERIKTVIYVNSSLACSQLAREIVDLILSRRGQGKNTVLGLATGSTPVGLYRELIRLHREEKVSFRDVYTFNLDEYFGLSPSHSQSYSHFMQEQLFQHVDIPSDHIHVPDGTLPRQKVFEACKRYENRILELGGIDLQVLGIGRTGHIGFNEPGSGVDSRTRLISLDSLTRRDAARDFLGENNVPRYAITMGVGTILDARQVVLLAWGTAKAQVVARAVEGQMTDSLPASFLQRHPNVRFLIDEAASTDLTRIRYPWKTGEVEWNPERVRQALVWLAESQKKPILKLTDAEYNEHGIAELVTSQGPAYELNIRVFNELQHTITGWPGGKPNADDALRPERANPFPKRSIVLSPEPLDDVLWMGGTLSRLVEQRNEVTVVYATSGNLAVPDPQAIRAVDLVLEIEKNARDDGAHSSTQLARKVKEQFLKKSPFDADSAEIRRVKGLIRQEEARAACQICGLSLEHIRFLNLPFYEEGHYRNFQPAARDAALVAEVLEEIQPHQIFVTGSHADPLSVQGICFELLIRALSSLRAQPWVRECYIWLYRGSESEWQSWEIEMAVPLSPGELAKKIQGIYQHQSQRSQTPIVSDRHRETWQQAEAINSATADLYNRLGLPEYAAIETFKRWHLEAGNAPI